MARAASANAEEFLTSSQKRGNVSYTRTSIENKLKRNKKQLPLKVLKKKKGNEEAAE